MQRISTSNLVVIEGGIGLPAGWGGGGGSGGGGGAVYGPTAAGSAAANPPVLMGGTIDGTATGNVDNWKVASGLGYVLAVGAGTAGSPSGGLLTIQGSTAAGSAVASYPVLMGGSDGTDVRIIATTATGQTIVAKPNSDVAVGGAAAPADANIAGAVYNATPITVVTTQAAALQSDVNGFLKVNVAAGGGTGGTSLADQAAFTQTSTAITPIGCLYIGSYASITTGHAGVVSCTAAGSMHTTIDNVNPNGVAIAANSSPVVNPVLTVAGAAVVKGGVPVVNGASFYQTQAASTSITALTGGSGGATGDYLSHCTVIPTSTSPGVFTITDNATAIYSFPGGASSLSNLVPFTVPVGANSVSGAWKITTGAGLSAVCVGKFT